MSRQDQESLTIHHAWHLQRAISEFKNCDAKLFLLYSTFNSVPTPGNKCQPSCFLFQSDIVIIHFSIGNILIHYDVSAELQDFHIKSRDIFLILSTVKIVLIQGIQSSSTGNHTRSLQLMGGRDCQPRVPEVHPPKQLSDRYMAQGFLGG